MIVVIAGFISILLLVIAHEAGHFWAARKAGIEVEEFGVGLPPKAKTLGKRNGTEYTINWLPVGGFVKLKGEHDADTTPGSFGAARLRDKVRVMVAGVFVNFMIAYILFTLIALIGMPKLLDDQFVVASDSTTTRQDVIISAVVPQSPAENAGLQYGDVLVSLQPICGDDAAAAACSPCEQRVATCSEQPLTSETVKERTKLLAGQRVDITYMRDGQTMMTIATFNDDRLVEESKTAFEACRSSGTKPEDCPPLQSYFGILPTDYTVQRATWSAPIVGAGVSVQIIEATLKGLGTIVTGLSRGDTAAATEQVSGVVGVGFVFSYAKELGWVFVLMIVAAISLSLAIMNVLPIPALDGGRLFVTLLFRVLKKPLTKDLEERIHGTGFVALLVLFVLITIVDVQRFVL